VTTVLALALLATLGFGPAVMTGSACAQSAKPSARAAVQDAEEVLEGNLEVIVEDSAGGSRTLYFLITGQKRVPLRFVKAPPSLRTGIRVRLRGNYEAGGRFVVVSFERVPAA
jgi:hypothetical protein